MKKLILAILAVSWCQMASAKEVTATFNWDPIGEKIWKTKLVNEHQAKDTGRISKSAEGIICWEVKPSYDNTDLPLAIQCNFDDDKVNLSDLSAIE